MKFKVSKDENNSSSNNKININSYNKEIKGNNYNNYNIYTNNNTNYNYNKDLKNNNYSNYNNNNDLKNENPNPKNIYFKINLKNVNTFFFNDNIDPLKKNNNNRNKNYYYYYNDINDFIEKNKLRKFNSLNIMSKSLIKLKEDFKSDINNSECNSKKEKERKEQNESKILPFSLPDSVSVNVSNETNNLPIIPVAVPVNQIDISVNKKKQNENKDQRKISYFHKKEIRKEIGKKKIEQFLNEVLKK